MIDIRCLCFVPVLGIISCASTNNEPPPAHGRMFRFVDKFDSIDSNNDGYVTRSELETGVNANGEPALTSGQLDRVMVVYDTNKDGKISLAEAKAAAEIGPMVFGQ